MNVPLAMFKNITRAEMNVPLAIYKNITRAETNHGKDYKKLAPYLKERLKLQKSGKETQLLAVEIYKTPSPQQLLATEIYKLYFSPQFCQQLKYINSKPTILVVIVI